MSGEGRRGVSGWFILSAVYLVLVFGLFFTFTERRTWPESGLRLGPSDMRLLPPLSTLWCEAVEMHSHHHPFVAYQVSYEISVNPMRMELQTVDLRTRLGVNWGTRSVKLKYFLLPSSIIEIFACASHPYAMILVFKGDLDVERCSQSVGFDAFPKASYYDEMRDSDESSEEDYGSTPSSTDSVENSCSSLIAQKFVDVHYRDEGYSADCSPATRLYPLKVNATSADEYAIVMLNLNRQHVNHLNLQILLDRTRYKIRRNGQPLDICSLSNACTIGLDFASGDRVLVSIPDEQNSGRYSFDVQYRCKPRLAVFAILSVFLPLLLFVALAMVIRTDRETLFAKIFCFRKRDRRNLNPPRFVSPLLEGSRSVESFDVVTIPEDQQSDSVDEPPPYNSLYDPPPPYSCVGDGKVKTSPSR